MTGLPRERTLDSTPALLREGWQFVSRRCLRAGTDAFETRLLLEPAVCMLGRDAAALLYSDRVTRHGALPRPILRLLQGERSALVLDGARHRERKRVLLDLVGPEALTGVRELAQEHWRAGVERWAQKESVTLLPAAEEALCRFVCEWTGVEPYARLGRDLAALIDGAGSFGVRNVRGQLARTRVDRWARTALDAAPRESIAGSLARALERDAAVVELINVLRPTVAVARYVVFCALALHEFPHTRNSDSRSFVQEVRRYYPFFPAATGRVREETDWHGHRFPVGLRVFLDLYGTNHDPRIWDHPEEFDPARFDGRDGDLFGFVPQGAGEHASTHRCPGEWLTLELMQVALRFLTDELDYDVPAQDLRLRPSRLPPRPESGFVIRPRKTRRGFDTHLTRNTNVQEVNAYGSLDG